MKERKMERKKEKERKLHAITFHHDTNNPPTTTPSQNTLFPTASAIYSIPQQSGEEQRVEKREGGGAGAM